MTDHTNSGCACTPNTSIRCAVTNCANHCKDGQYCGLNAIQVGTHEANPTWTSAPTARASSCAKHPSAPAGADYLGGAGWKKHQNAALPARSPAR